MVAALLGISPPTFVALSHYSVVWLDHMCYLKKKKKNGLRPFDYHELGNFYPIGNKVIWTCELFLHITYEYINRSVVHQKNINRCVFIFLFLKMH